MRLFKSKFIVVAFLVSILIVAGYIIFPHFGRKMIDKAEPKESARQESQPMSTPEIVDKQASFAIFTNGTLRVFTAKMYHNLSPNVFIEASNPNLIQIKKDGLSWSDFFATLPFKLTGECLTTGTGQTFCTGPKGTLSFYINGSRIDNALSKEIHTGDKILITYGNESAEQIQKQLDTLNSL